MSSVIPWEVWEGWMSRACELNEYVAEESRVSGAPVADRAVCADDPGTDFNRRAGWADTGLLDSDWSWCRRTSDDRGTLTRPGKDRGVSATVGMITSKRNGWPLFWCFSTSVPEFKPETPYTKFGVYAVLNHRGDFKEAAKALAARGYGAPPATLQGRLADSLALPAVEVNGTHAGADAPPEPDRPYLWMSELRFREANDKWLWKGYVSRGGMTLLSAIWKSGKSTLLSHLIRAFDGRTESFCGHEIVPSRVLYVTEEDQETWAERRDALGIGDHVGMINRPFMGRSNPAQWSAFVGALVRAVQDYGFDLVVFDTISKLWPVREENDANQVEDALMPLWQITNTGAALLLVHHTRKSDGKEFTAARGSGGLSAFAETLVEMRRYSEKRRDTRRLLTAAGRYTETPDRWVVDLTAAGYVGLGDPDDVPGGDGEVGDWRTYLDGILPAKPPGLTVDEVQAVLETTRAGEGVRNRDLIELLNNRFDGGEYLRIGKGVKGSPFRFYRPAIGSEDACPPPQSGGETNSGTESEAGD